MSAKNGQNTQTVRSLADHLFQLSPLLKRHITHMPVFHGEGGLSLSLYQILSLLNEREYMSVSGLSLYVGIAKPNITPLIDHLSSDGLVERVRSTEDRRVVFVRIRPEGRERLTQIAKQLEAHIGQWRERLGDEGFARFSACVEEMCSYLDKL